MYLSKGCRQNHGQRISAGKIVFIKDQKASKQRETSIDFNRRVLRIFWATIRACYTMHWELVKQNKSAFAKYNSQNDYN